ncbi:hypothetical protein [Humisphaera borealis]|uniref:Uncharacterized protein n=1 Tax=Humisphaera borealis TaxID=2807512 RepID=A0A7M2WPN2_9BACT|nr:hypothetical protein [Humisphaera borealis]QOV87373.1 hypothetical protein IPV69_13845 [Humisphaera borealis]
MPDIDRPDNPREVPAASVDGRWIVLIVVALGVILGLIGLKFRQPSPMQREKSQPATAPAANQD